MGQSNRSLAGGQAIEEFHKGEGGAEEEDRCGAFGAPLQFGEQPFRREAPGTVGLPIADKRRVGSAEVLADGVGHVDERGGRALVGCREKEQERPPARRVPRTGEILRFETLNEVDPRDPALRKVSDDLESLVRRWISINEDISLTWSQEDEVFEYDESKLTREDKQLGIVC